MQQKQRPTRDDVARRAEVSGATVSRVLSGRADFSITHETRTRVLDAARAIGYRPNQVARSLVTGRTNVVGFWARDSFDPFYAGIAGRVNRLAAESGYHLVAQDLNPFLNGSNGNLQSLQGRVDGALVCDLSNKYQSLVTALCPPEMPRVGLGVFYPTQGDYVGVDLRAGADEAMQHLLDSGRRRIAMLLPQPWLSLTEARPDAYRRAMDRAGLPHRFIAAERYGRAAAREAVKRYLAAEERPDALFCTNDDGAIGCYRGLRDLGLRVPEDVALVGCDGIEDTEYLETPLTTIVQPVEELSRLGWEFLRRRMADPELPPQQTVLKAQLAIRASSARTS